MKKIILYIVLISVGLALGYFIFGHAFSEPTKQTTTEEATEHDHHKKETEVWTCSMHPQIQKPEPGKCPICGMDLILKKSTEDDSDKRFELTKTAVALANVETMTVGFGDS